MFNVVIECMLILCVLGGVGIVLAVTYCRGYDNGHAAARNFYHAHGREIFGQDGDQ